MRAWRVLLASVVVHVVVLGVVRLEWDAWIPPVVSVSVTPRVELVDVSAPPIQTIDVAMLDDAPTATPVRAGTARVSSQLGTTSHATTGTGRAIAEPGRGSETGKGMMKMRGPELHPGDAALEHIADAPGHEPVAVIPSQRLEDAPGGRAVIHDTVTTISVDRDGTAHLDDKPDVEVHFDANPLHLWRGIKGFGASIADWAQDPEAGKAFGKTQDLPAHLQAVQGACDHYGSTMCDDPNAPGAEQGARQTDGGGGLSILSGKFDVTSLLMRKLGIGDAYASRKLKALDDTRLERAERGAQYKTAQLGKAAQIMQQNLQRMWSGTQDLNERKALLFELWDECVEGEGALGEAGEKARQMVIGWIRANLPDGSADAYTAREVDLLDRRRTSKQHFAPY